jgi:hypothetical protein
MLHAAACLALLLGLVAAPALGCAVPTRFVLRNETGLRVRQVMIADDGRSPLPGQRDNILPPAGIAPGAAVTLTMPSCIGVYVLTAVLSDGTERRRPGLDARRLRELALR